MFSKKSAIVCAAAAALGLSVPAVHAATYVLTDPGAVTGDTAAIATTAQADIGNGSWQAATSKTSVYLAPSDVGLPASTTIGDLTSLSWKTYKTSADGANDWYLTIYTAPTGTGDAASWYHNRITFEPRYANSYSDPTDQWVTWSTGSGTDQVTFYDDKTGGTYPGFYSGPTLSALTSGAVNWGNYANSGSTNTVDYTGDTIKFFTLQTASGWTPAYQGYLDNFQIGTTGGSAQVNFDVVPEPSSMGIFLGLAGLALLSRRSRRRIA